MTQESDFPSSSAQGKLALGMLRPLPVLVLRMHWPLPTFFYPGGSSPPGGGQAAAFLLSFVFGFQDMSARGRTCWPMAAVTSVPSAQSSSAVRGAWPMAAVKPMSTASPAVCSPARYGLRFPRLPIPCLPHLLGGKLGTSCSAAQVHQPLLREELASHPWLLCREDHVIAHMVSGE